MPVLLIHGSNDTVVPFTQSSRMAAALRQPGKTVDFVMKHNPPEIGH